MSGAADTAGTAVAVPLLKEVRGFAVSHFIKALSNLSVNGDLVLLI